MKTTPRFIVALVTVTAILAMLGTLLLASSPHVMAAGPAAREGGLGPEAATLGVLAAALSTALAALGAGFAVAKVGAAAIGALAEKPELFGRLLILVGLAEGIAIYGLIVSILILNRLG
jgi:V/A-type H+-transporting ATPase subunit K